MSPDKFPLTTASIEKEGLQQEIEGADYPEDNACFVLEKGNDYLMYTHTSETQRKKEVVKLEYLAKDGIVRAVFEPTDSEAEREIHFIKLSDVLWMNRKEETRSQDR